MQGAAIAANPGQVARATGANYGLHASVDVIKSNAGNRSGIGMIDEVSRRTPFMSRGAFRSIKGFNYKTLVQTGSSNTTGSFRTLNSGVASATSTEENRLVETFPIQPRFHV